jgi:hypothetical protein
MYDHLKENKYYYFYKQYQQMQRRIIGVAHNKVSENARNK